MRRQPSSVKFYFKAILLAASWMNHSELVKSACIEDVLSFFNEDISCEFNMQYFSSNFMDKGKKCLSNCSVESSTPSYDDMKIQTIYRIEELTIKFSQTVAFQQTKSWTNCGWWKKIKMSITFNCEDQIKEEKCINDGQCYSNNSICNTTTEECVCRQGYLRKSNTCIKARHLGENCSKFEQCQEENSFCNIDSYCTCRSGFIQYSNSCSKVRKLGESCEVSEQCTENNPDSTCNMQNATGVCQCTEDFLNVSNICLPARNLNENCSDSQQCQATNGNTVCNVESSTCGCLDGFIQQSNSCLQVRKLGESCKEARQCSLATNNSTCNTTEEVCQCTEGHLMVHDTCIPDRLLLDKCERNQEHLESDELNNFRNVSSASSASISNSSETSKSDGVIIGVGMGGFLAGICVGAALFYIFARRQKKSRNSLNRGSEDEGMKLQHVEVSGDMTSGRIVGGQKRTNTTQENAEIYNHLHEKPVELNSQENAQSDYDHCPPQTASDDMYSHLASGNDKSENSTGDYGDVN